MKFSVWMYSVRGYECACALVRLRMRFGMRRWVDSAAKQRSQPPPNTLGQNAVAVSYADSGKRKFSALNAEKWATNLYSVPNLIVCSHYFNIGFALMFLATPVRIRYIPST